MPKLQKNSIGFFPKIINNSDDISISILSNKSIKVHKASTTAIEVYYSNTLISSGTEDIITFSEDIIGSTESKEIIIIPYKNVFNYIIKYKAIKFIVQNLTCCSKDDLIIIPCSNNLKCL